MDRVKRTCIGGPSHGQTFDTPRESMLLGGDGSRHFTVVAIATRCERGGLFDEAFYEIWGELLLYIKTRCYHQQPAVAP